MRVLRAFAQPRAVLDHLLKSGAGTAFYDAVNAVKRDRLTEEFLRFLAQRHNGDGDYEVRHDYVACIAEKSRSLLLASFAPWRDTQPSA
jgi:hypothetical protein